MAPGNQKRRRVSTPQLQPREAISASSSEPQTPTTPLSSAASTSTNRGRGPTRGKGLEKINKAAGTKMVIEIAKAKRRPVIADQSSKLANELGIIARNLLPVPTKWKALSEEDKSAALDRLTTRFNINLEENYVRDSCEDLLKGRSKDERYRHHQRFKKHGSIEEAQRDVPRNMSQDTWNKLIDLFADPKYQERCEINKNNRAKQTTNHHEGSKAFVVVRHEKRNKVTGEEPNRIEFYKDIHCKDGWDSEQSKALYDEMKRIETQSTLEGNPMDPDEIADRVLGTRSGYIKGLGHGPKPAASASLKQKNFDLEEALRDSNRNNTILLEQLKANEVERESQRAMIENIAAKQAAVDQILQSLVASGLIPSSSFTPGA